MCKVETLIQSTGARSTSFKPSLPSGAASAHPSSSPAQLNQKLPSPRNNVRTRSRPIPKLIASRCQPASLYGFPSLPSPSGLKFPTALSYVVCMFRQRGTDTGQWEMLRWLSFTLSPAAAVTVSVPISLLPLPSTGKSGSERRRRSGLYPNHLRTQLSGRTGGLCSVWKDKIDRQIDKINKAFFSTWPPFVHC